MKIKAFWVGTWVIAGLLATAQAGIVVLNSNQGDYTFRGTNTYYLTNLVTIDGMATFEAGTVIKYGSGAKLAVWTVDCQTTSNNPAVFTSRDDDTFGAILPDSLHVPMPISGADTAIDVLDQGDDENFISLQHLKIFYAMTGIHFENSDACWNSSDTLEDITIAWCDTAIYSDVAGLTLDYGRISHCGWIWGSYWFASINHLVLTDCGIEDTGYYGNNLTICNSTLANCYINGNSMTVTGSSNRFYNVVYDTGDNSGNAFGSDYQLLDLHAPSALAQTVQTSPNLAVNITLTASSPDGKPLTYIVIDSPAHGRLSGTLPNLTYTPVDNYIGPDSFVFTVDDGVLDSTNAMVSIFVDEPVNFMLVATNKYLTNRAAAFNIDLSQGAPAYKSILVNTDNFATATWSAYTSSNLTVNLPGTADGNHSIWVGLKSASPLSQPVWENITFTIDNGRLHLVITNPIVVNGTVTVGVPLIQIQGRVDKFLADLTYDVSNALDVVTNNKASIVDRTFDTNRFDFTTNYFQCYDIQLTNGLNLITVHGTDRAGNTITTNLAVTLDYSVRTNGPDVKILVPHIGVDVSCQGIFSVIGQSDDATARISAYIVDSANHTNSFWGVIERTGRFWVEGMPLASGTNFVSLTVTGASGYSTVTNFNVVRSTKTLTINIPSANALCYDRVNVTGTISDPNQAVWCNGVKGKNHGDGTWSAVAVPIQGGVAIFSMDAYEPNEQQPDGSYGNP